MKQVNFNDRQFIRAFGVVSFLIGLLFRISFVIRADFPFNDGGMFTTIVEEILAAGLRLPAFSNFNSLEIPLLYPPLGFYLAAVLVKITGVEPIIMMQYLPVILSSFTIPAFFYFSKTLYPSTKTPYLATIIYIFIPRSWIWLIMGGGLTRSLGLVFAVIAMIHAYKFILQEKSKSLIWMIIFTSLTILSHPETAVFLVLAIILVFLVFSRKWRTFIKLARAGGLVAALTSVWWLRGILLYGYEPFITAFTTGGMGFHFIRHLLLFGITEEYHSLNIAVLAILGFFVLLTEKKHFLPLWLLVILAITPRSGSTFAMIPVSLMSSVALIDVILPALDERSKSKLPSPPDNPKRYWSNKLLLGYLFISLLLSAILQPYIPDSGLEILSSDERAAMKWVSENVSESSQFVVITGEEFSNDQAVEWFPYLASRYSITTLQGSEWIPDGSFAMKWDFYADVNECFDAPENCLEPLTATYRFQYSHIYLSLTPDTRAMYLYLKNNPGYSLLYDGPGAAVFGALQVQ